MKSLKTYFLLTGCFMLVSVAQTSAQSAQMEREVRIAERIIEELFSDLFLSEQRSGSSVQVHSEYIPGTGIHFLVNENPSSIFTGIYIGQASIDELPTGDSGEENNNEGKKKKTVTIVDIEERIFEYLTNYSAQLQLLESGEVLRISFGINRGRNSSFNFNTLFGNNTDSSELPALSLWIAADDVRRFRDAELTTEQFLRSINRTEIDNEDLPRDITIFSSILTTALQDADLAGLSVNQNVETHYLSGWGAEFTVNIRSGIGFDFNISELVSRESMEEVRQSLQEAREDLKKARIEVQEFDILNDMLRTNLDSVRKSLAVMYDSLQVHVIDPGTLQYSGAGGTVLDGISGSNDQRKFTDEDILKSRELIEELVVSIINDYGSTLTSLNSGEFLKITLKWRGRQNILPEETQFFIRKSNLESNRDVTVTSRPRS